ncbi:MAG: hypothetical protein ACK4OM_04235 [Alphaproteobacteria bacterium]
MFRILNYIKDKITNFISKIINFFYPPNNAINLNQMVNNQASLAPYSQDMQAGIHASLNDIKLTKDDLSSVFSKRLFDLELDEEKYSKNFQALLDKEHKKLRDLLLKEDKKYQNLFPKEIKCFMMISEKYRPVVDRAPEITKRIQYRESAHTFYTDNNGVSHTR